MLCNPPKALIEARSRERGSPGLLTNLPRRLGQIPELHRWEPGTSLYFLASLSSFSFFCAPEKASNDGWKLSIHALKPNCPTPPPPSLLPVVWPPLDLIILMYCPKCLCHKSLRRPSSVPVTWLSEESLQPLCQPGKLVLEPSPAPGMPAAGMINECRCGVLTVTVSAEACFVLACSSALHPHTHTIPLMSVSVLFHAVYGRAHTLPVIINALNTNVSLSFPSLGETGVPLIG